jgi:glycosyltransferase involved in cell wall biosynthesis
MSIERSNLHVAVDARYLSHGLVGGVHTYVRNLVQGFGRLDEPVRFSLWADEKAPFELTSLPESMQLWRMPWRGPASSVLNDRRIGTAMLRAGADVAHFPANYGSAPAWLPSVITIHDAINLLPLPEILRGHAKQLKTMLAMTYLHFITTSTVRRNPTVVTVSEYSRREILRHSTLAPERVHVVPSAAESCFIRFDPAEREAIQHQYQRRYQLRKRVLLADAIKNPECVLRAVQALPDSVRQSTSLVFFSRREPPEAVTSAAEANECTLIMRPEQAELVALYNLADLFVFPSWYEGFGLPALEAMSCGAPVIASTRGALPEVVGDAGVTADADDHRAFAAAIANILESPDLHADLRRRALARAAGYSWERTALQTLAVYRAAYQVNAHAPTSGRLAPA